MKTIQPKQFYTIGGQISFWQWVRKYELQGNKIISLPGKVGKSYYPLDDDELFDEFINLSTSLEKKGLQNKTIEREVFNFVKRYGYLGFYGFFNKHEYAEILEENKNVGYERVEDILNESKRLKLIIEFYNKIKKSEEYTKESLEDFKKDVPEEDDYYYLEGIYNEIEKITNKIITLPRIDGSYAKGHILLPEGTKINWYPFKFFAKYLNEEFNFYLNNISINVGFGKVNQENKPLSERFFPTIKLNSLLQVLYVKLYLIISGEGNIAFCDVCGGPYLKTNGNKKGHAKCIKRRSAYKAMGKWNK
jgi:hypothetical protein